MSKPIPCCEITLSVQDAVSYGILRICQKLVVIVWFNSWNCNRILKYK